MNFSAHSPWLPFAMGISRRRFVLVTLGASLASATGCGLLIYPERRGQSKGRLDWGIVMLDSLGLLLFFLPGVVAFIVDFATGTIYLPPEGRATVSGGKNGDAMTKIQLSRDQMTRERIEQVVTNHIGRPVQLQDGKYRTEQLDSVDDYWPTVGRMTREAS